MSPLKSSLLAAVSAAAVTAGALYWVNHSRAQEAASLRLQNDRMRADAHARLRAQAQASLPEVSPVTNDPVGDANPAPPASPVSTRTVPENYRNDGTATPLAALQTFAWACDRGDVETVEKMIWWEGGSRAKVEAFLASLPESARADWKSVDAMVAAELTHSIMVGPFPSADVLDVALMEKIGDDRMMLRLSGTSKDRTQFQQTTDGWKYVITEAMVDRYLAQVAGTAQR